MLITPNFRKKSLILEQFQGNYINRKKSIYRQPYAKIKVLNDPDLTLKEPTINK